MPPQLPLQTHPHISQTHTQAAQGSLSHALILSFTLPSHSSLAPYLLPLLPLLLVINAILFYDFPLPHSRPPHFAPWVWECWYCNPILHIYNLELSQAGK